jgi:hypothetical protein
MFTVIQFTGTGDPMFGGNADDRALYVMGARTADTRPEYAFVRGCDAYRLRRAEFATRAEAETAAAYAMGRVAGAPLSITA